MRHALLLILAGLVGWPTVALGNGFSVGGQGRDLYPVEQSEVVMQSESIELIQVSLLEWSVVATYVFATDSDVEETVQLGFPEAACLPREGCGDPTFHGMQTTVDGVELENRTGELAAEHAQDNADLVSGSGGLGRVWVYDIVVPAGGEVTVVHRYRYVPMERSYTMRVYFITTTGALWPAPIEHAEFRVWFQGPVNWATVPETWGAPAVIRRPQDEEGGTPTSFAFEWVFDDWVPEENLYVQYDTEWAYNSTECPSIRTFIEELERSSEEEQIERLRYSAEEARECRNLMYALHGYTFRDEQFNESLYPHTCSHVREPRICWFREPSDDYVPELLGYDEHRYIEVMQALEELLAAESPESTIYESADE